MILPKVLISLCAVVLMAVPSWGQCGVAPLSEDFNASVAPMLPAGWLTSAVVTGVSREWTTDAFGTPSLGTGPTDDCRVPGGNYVFVESSGSSAGEVAILTPPCADTLGLSAPAVVFCYHMMFGGQASGTLEVQTSPDSGVTWNTVISITGDQGPDWKTGVAPVPATAQLDYRFVFTVGSGSTFLYDAALDDIRVQEVPSPEWQVNTPEASLDVDGVTVQDPFGPNWAFAALCTGEIATVNVASALMGNPWDMIITLAPDPDPIPTSQGGVVTADGEVVHISPTFVTASYFNGGQTPDLASTAITDFNLPLLLGTVVTVNAQMGVLNPVNLTGLSFSQATQLQVTGGGTFPLNQGDDTAIQIPLGVICANPITFYGATYSAIFVGANGGVTFTSASTDFSPTVLEWQTQMPRVGIHSDFLLPAAANGSGTNDVVVDGAGNLSVVWTNAEEWSPGGGSLNTMSYSVDFVGTAVAISGYSVGPAWTTGTVAGLSNGLLGTHPAPVSFDGAFGAGLQFGLPTDSVIEGNPLGAPVNAAGWSSITFPNSDGSTWAVN